MASSSRRGARRDATASSASARAGPAAGADLEALVRELLELERFTERRERMLSRTQTRQLERHEREQRDAREREAIAARLARELTVSRERLERLERRERRRRETRARRVETTGSRDAREDDRETRAETSSRRSRSAPLDAESDRLDHRGRRDHHEREGARDEPAARRVDTVASDSASSASRSATSSPTHSSATHSSARAPGVPPSFSRPADALTTEVARLRRRVSRLARAESASPGEDRGEIRSAPRGSASRRSAPTDFFSDQRGAFSSPSGAGFLRARRRRARHSSEGVFRVLDDRVETRPYAPPYTPPYAFDEFGDEPRGGATPSLRPDSAVDWETERERLREFVLDAAEFGVSRRARGFRRDGHASGTTRNARRNPGFLDEPRAVSVGRELRSSRDDWFPMFRNRAGASFGTDRPRAPRRDPRFASPLRSRQRNRDAGGDGAHAARADDTADERGASPPESGAHDDAPVAARRRRDRGGPPEPRGAASVRRASPSGGARVGDADVELARLLSERPGFAEMLAGVLASMRALPAADLREACVGVITGTPPRAAEARERERLRGGLGDGDASASPARLSDDLSGSSDSEFAYRAYAYASLEPPRGASDAGTARAAGAAPAGAPWDGADVPGNRARDSLGSDPRAWDRGAGPAARVAPAVGARRDARASVHAAETHNGGAESGGSGESGEIVTFSDLFGGAPVAARDAPAPAVAGAGAADPLAPAPPPPPASVPTAADAAALVARHASGYADTRGEARARASPPPPPPPLGAEPGGRGPPRAEALAASAAASPGPGGRKLSSRSLADAADADSGHLSVDAEAIARLLAEEQRAQRDAEMSPFAAGAHDEEARFDSDSDARDPAADGRGVAAAGEDLDEVAASRFALGVTDEDRSLPPPSAPETLGEAASRLPFSETLNATLLEALGSVVADAGGAAAEAAAAAAAADAEALEARAVADARAAAAAAEIAAARAQSSAPVSARVARQNGEALASHAAANAGPSPASASTAPAAPPSPGAKRRFKERLEMFNAPASSSRVEYRTVH